MIFKLSRRIFSINLFAFVVLTASGAIPSAVAQTFPATVEFISPVMDDIIDTTSDNNPKQLRVVLDQKGDLTDFERVHYECGEVAEGNAADVRYDQPNKSGVVPIDLYTVAPDSDHNGPYECCVYLADFDRNPITDTVCSTFTLHTAGALLHSPRNNDQFNNFQISVNFTRIGIEARTVAVTVDNNPAILNSDTFGLVSLPALSNGTHTLTIQAKTVDGDDVGVPRIVQFQIASDLTPENVDNAEAILKKARRTRSNKKRKRLLKKLDELLTDMSFGGTVDPEHAGLTAERIKSALSNVEKARKKRNNPKKLKRFLKIALGELLQTKEGSAE